MPTKEKQRSIPSKNEEQDTLERKKGPFDDILEESDEIIEEAEQQQQKGRKGGQ